MVVKTQAYLLEKRELSPTTMHFIFKCEDDFMYKAGQFINFIIDKQDSTRPMRRAYSICSAYNSTHPREFELCVKLEGEGEFTPLLFNSSINDSFNVMGPLGLFKLHSNTQEDEIIRDQVFIGAGSGIAPLRSFIRELLINQNFTRNVTLLFGARSEEEILFKDELDKLEQEYSNFNYIITLSRPSANWDGLTGYVQDHLTEIGNISSSQIYICGRTKMVDGVHHKLDELDIAKEQRHHEKFG
ncbi:MAG: FAD-dependent oxidoreductase [Candidatus Nanoarchaeia archaeon]